VIDVVTLQSISNRIRDEFIKEMYTHFYKRANTLVFTKDIEELWNSLSGYEAPADAAYGRRRNLESLIFDLPAGEKAKIWWDLPKFTDSVYIHAYLESPRYTRVRLVNTDTGDYYEVEAYPPASTADNRVYKYVGGTKSDNINVIGGKDLPAGLLWVLSWDSRGFLATLWGFVARFDSCGYGAVEERPWIMRDTDITEINRIEMEWENNDTTTRYGEIGIILAPLYAPVLITYR